jgi:uncharacterized protein involved in exopolysaccharide biosynthesis
MRDYLTVIFKHKSKILIVFLATVITVTIGALLIPKVYEAKSSLMIKAGREYSYRPEVGELRQELRVSSEEIINSEVQILTSKDLVEKAISNIGVENIYPELVETPPEKITPLEAAVLKLREQVSVRGIKNSKVIEISFQHGDPEIAARFVNQLVELFKEKHLQVFSNPKSSFIEEQLTVYSQRLTESQSKLVTFKQKYPDFSLDEQRTLLVQQSIDMEISLETTQNRIKELQQKVLSLDNQMRVLSQNARQYTNTGVDEDAKAQLLALQIKEQELLGKYNENNRLVVNVRKEIQLVKDFLQGQEKNLGGMARTGNNPVYQETNMELIRARAELSSLEAKKVAIEEQLIPLDEKVKTSALMEKEFQNLKREMATNEKNYQVYLDKYEEARILENMDRLKMANIGMIYEAAVPSLPVKSNKKLKVLMGMVLGAVLGLGLAFFSEYNSQVLSSPESVEKHLGITVLATVPDKEG